MRASPSRRGGQPGGTENVTNLGSVSTVPTYVESGSNLLTKTSSISGGTYTSQTRMVDLVANAYAELVAGKLDTHTTEPVMFSRFR